MNLGRFHHDNSYLDDYALLSARAVTEQKFRQDVNFFKAFKINNYYFQM